MVDPDLSSLSEEDREVEKRGRGWIWEFIASTVMVRANVGDGLGRLGLRSDGIAGRCCTIYETGM
jgi:hypothetical protein